MIKFNLKDRDKKTGVRTGVFKSNQNTFSTPERTLVSTELNYQNGVKDIVKDLDFPNDAFVAQLKVDAKSLWTRDNDYYNSLIRQAQRYTSQIVKKTCILKVHLYVPRREKQTDGRYKRKEIPLRNRSVDLSDEQRQRIIRSIISLGHEAEFDGICLPYTDRAFRLSPFFQSIKTAHLYALNQLNSGIEIIPEVPHDDNIDDFEKALYDFKDKYSEGIISIPFKALKGYHFTHMAVKNFSEKDDSEKIGILCTDTPRKHPFKAVSHPHYTLLQGYDIVAREIPKYNFLRKDGKTKDDKKAPSIYRFNRSKLSIDVFDKGLMFDTSKVDTLCPELKKYTHKELFREAVKSKALDVVLKIMETFDSHKEMQDCRPYIASGDFKGYLKEKKSLDDAYKDDFLNRQKSLSDF